MILNIKINKNHFLFIIFVSICFQFNEIKLFDIKISELILLISGGTLFFQRVSINKWILIFFIFFSVLLIKTIIQDYFTKFYINTELSVLKYPYFISISRYFEFLCCLFFVLLVTEYFKLKSLDEVLEISLKCIKFQIYFFGILYVLFFFLYEIGLPNVNGFLVYDTTPYSSVTYRIRGFFVEGGPFGLFYAYLYVLYEWLLNRLAKKDIVGKFLVLSIVFFASSKAGFSMLLLYFAYKIYLQTKKNRYRIIFKNLVVPIALGLSIFLIYYLLSGYIGTIGRELQLSSTEINGANGMGRITGLVIVPNMLSNNFLWGIGLGNYALLRNNPLYLGYLPQIPVNLWDSPGLGGLIDLLVDGGLILFILFCYLFYRIFKEIRYHKSLHTLFFTFITPFVFGVQLYFIYPWFSLALIILFMKRSV